MKRTTLIAAAFGGMTAFGSTVAFAQDTAMPNFVDANNNGSWSLEEIVVNDPQMTAEAFAKIDMNADGEASKDEMAAAVTAGTLVIAPAADLDATDGGALVDGDNDGKTAVDLADDDASDDGNTAEPSDSGADAGTNNDAGDTDTGANTDGGTTN